MTGATGAIGPGIVAELASTHAIRTLARRPAPANLYASPVEECLGDVTDADRVGRAASGTDLIVHLAALLHLNDPPPSMRAEYERVNVHGTATVLAAARAAGVRRVVVLSTIAVYGYSRGALLDEASVCSPDTVYGQTKLEAEQRALAARRPDGSPLATVLRPAAVYGPRMRGNYQRLVRALARRRFVPLGPGTNRRTLVFEADLAAAVAAAAAHPDAAGRAYNVTDGEPHPLHRIIDSICGALGRRPPRWHPPAVLVRAAVTAGGLVHAGLPRMLDKYLEDVAVAGDRIGREIGFQPRVDLDEGWRRTILELRRIGAIPRGRSVTL